MTRESWVSVSEALAHSLTQIEIRRMLLTLTHGPRKFERPAHPHSPHGILRVFRNTGRELSWTLIMASSGGIYRHFWKSIKVKQQTKDSTRFCWLRGISIGEQTGIFQIKAGNISTVSTWKAGRRRRTRKSSLLAVLVLFGQNMLMLLKGKSSTRN